MRVQTIPQTTVNKKVSFESTLKYIPYLSAVAYLLGYVILNAHLSTYGIHEFNLVSFDYLKTGIFFLILVAPIGLIIWRDIRPKSPHLKDNLDTLFKATARIGFCFVIICFFLFRKPQASTAFAFGIAIYFLVTSFLNAKPAKKWKRVIALLFHFLPIICYSTYIVVTGFIPLIYFAFFFWVMYALILWINLDYRDGDAHPYFISIQFILLIIACAIFGFAVYRHVPNYLGGPKKTTMILIFADDKKNDLEQHSLTDSSKRNRTKSLNIIYQNAHMYYAHMPDGSILSLKKDLFLGEMIPGNTTK